MVRRRPLHHEAYEAIAIAIVDAAIYINIVDVSVIGLLETINYKLGLRGQLLGKRQMQFRCPQG